MAITLIILSTDTFTIGTATIAPIMVRLRLSDTDQTRSSQDFALATFRAVLRRSCPQGNAAMTSRNSRTDAGLLGVEIEMPADATGRVQNRATFSAGALIVSRLHSPLAPKRPPAARVHTWVGIGPSIARGFLPIGSK
jgi:hypothetical protein